MFQTKGYTISFFINKLLNTTKKFSNADTLYEALSPRKGGDSAMSYALDAVFNDQTANVVEGIGTYARLGKTPRARVLKALRLRKENKGRYISAIVCDL